MGGNTGAQALAVMIRGLALREVMTGTMWRILLKEMTAGFINGLVVAALTAGVTLAWYHTEPWLALVVGMAMVVNMMAAGVAGAAIPLALHAAGRDPAQASTIFLTTLTDVIGFAAFLGFAMFFIS